MWQTWPDEHAVLVDHPMPAVRKSTLVSRPQVEFPNNITCRGQALRFFGHPSQQLRLLSALLGSGLMISDGSTVINSK